VFKPKIARKIIVGVNAAPKLISYVVNNLPVAAFPTFTTGAKFLTLSLYGKRITLSPKTTHRPHPLGIRAVRALLRSSAL
jgi:hypothetical protein